MAANAFVDNAKVMVVRIVNSAVYAMQVLQQEMEKDAGRAGLYSEDDVMALVMI